MTRALAPWAGDGSWNDPIALTSGRCALPGCFAMRLVFSETFVLRHSKSMTTSVFRAIFLPSRGSERRRGDASVGTGLAIEAFNGGGQAHQSRFDGLSLTARGQPEAASGPGVKAGV